MKPRIWEAMKQVADREAELYGEIGRLADLEPDPARRAELIHQRGVVRQDVHRVIKAVYDWDKCREE